MPFRELLHLTYEAFTAHRLRYALSALAIVIGVAAVVLLSAIGEGTRLAIVDQFTQFGTNTVAINPGKTETMGLPGLVTGTVKPITLDDARILSRLPNIAGTVPLTTGTSIVKWRGVSRRVYIIGASSDMPTVWKTTVNVGQFLPEMDWDRKQAVAVLGPKLKREIFGEKNALGEPIRIAESRFRVIGVMEPKGTFLGFDLDDLVYIPVANGMQLFNRVGLDELDFVINSPDNIDPTVENIRIILTERHEDNEDFTITTMTDMLTVIERVLGIITSVVAAIAGISLVVGGIGILTVMWIVVNERTAEIGLVKAIGATRKQIVSWYLFEASLVAVAGGLIGLGIGFFVARSLSAVIPGLESAFHPTVASIALGMAIVLGLAAGIAPAIRAARLDPVAALRGE
jgi:putative ABC transport system permease protein